MARRALDCLRRASSFYNRLPSILSLAQISTRNGNWQSEKELSPQSVKTSKGSLKLEVTADDGTIDPFLIDQSRVHNRYWTLDVKKEITYKPSTFLSYALLRDKSPTFITQEWVIIGSGQYSAVSGPGESAGLLITKRIRSLRWLLVDWFVRSSW